MVDETGRPVQIPASLLAVGLVGSVYGGPRPEPGDRVAILATREIPEPAPLFGRAVRGGDSGTLSVEVDGERFDGITKWVLLPDTAEDAR